MHPQGLTDSSRWFYMKLNFLVETEFPFSLTVTHTLKLSTVLGLSLFLKLFFVTLNRGLRHPL